MHIKQVVISGFRSFRNQSEIEPFSPKHNVIVGRNGSGKSNFFDAIQFVLCGPRFANLRAEDRQHMLHEGTGTSVMATYVEIVFDNSDGRLSIESDEVVLRRTVGHKKDEFFLNRKRTQKAEVISLLESAGFSKSNPYYIVQQGKVAALCTMKDIDRLNLLKEVAGTTVYDERRSESLKIMDETNKRQDQMVEVLSFIEDRLNELEQEKEELKEYEVLDKTRRALEFNLHDKELNKVNEELSTMETTQDDARDKQQSLHSELREIEDSLVNEEDKLNIANEALDRLVNRRSKKLEDYNELVARRSAVEAELQEAEASKDAISNELNTSQAQLNQIKAQIVEKDQYLRTLGPQHESRQNDYDKISTQISGMQSRIDTLYGKQGRGREFKSIQERDIFLRSQIELLDEQINQQTTLVNHLRNSFEKDTSRVKNEEANLMRAESENRQKLSDLEKVQNSIKDCIQKRTTLAENRKTCWRDLETVQEQLTEAKHDHDRGKQALHKTLSRSITQGLATVEKIAREKNINGYFGPVIDNFELKNDAFRTAVEVAAGTSLFHVIVDTEKTAVTLMDELNKREAGMLTFLPLNRLQADAVEYPDSPDVRSLLDVAIDYDNDVESAMHFIFGKKLLARDLENAAYFSKEANLDAITIDGDVVSRKGGFEGGYHDERSSRIQAITRMRDANSQINALQRQEVNLKAAAEKADEDITEVLRDLSSLEAERDQIRSNCEQIGRELSNRIRANREVQQNMKEQERSLQSLESELVVVKNQKGSYEEEIGTPLHGKLSDSERSELRRLEEEQNDLRSELQSIQNDLIQLRSDRDKIIADLSGRLLIREAELENIIEHGGDNGRGNVKSNEASCANLVMERDQLKNLVDIAQTELDDVEGLVNEHKSSLVELEKEVEEHRASEREAQEKMSDAMKEQDKLLNQRTMLLSMILNKQRMIRELGTLPRQEMQEFKNLDTKHLTKRLKAVKDQLKKYSSVNRKALDQYVSFNEQREGLIARRDELEKDKDCINQLVKSLDQQKEEAILRTFTGVSKNFKDVFAELVPGGEGHLVMTTAMDETVNAEEGKTEDVEHDKDQTESSATSSSDVMQQNVNTFTGVQVKVKFADGGRTFDMQSLSGGQKALVALAIIFAIQRSDPVPFYLMDEIDQALDANYRAAVARLIQKQAESTEAPAQFITTTFRPELVAIADKHYGIAVMNKVSSIYPLDRSDAVNFVNNLMNAESVGQVSAVPSFQRANRLEKEKRSRLDEEDEEDEDEEGDDDQEGGDERIAMETE